MSKRQEDRHRDPEPGGMNEPPTQPFSRYFDVADAMGRTGAEYVGLVRQDALDAASDAVFEPVYSICP